MIVDELLVISLYSIHWILLQNVICIGLFLTNTAKDDFHINITKCVENKYSTRKLHDIYCERINPSFSGHRNNRLHIQSRKKNRILVVNDNTQWNHNWENDSPSTFWRNKTKNQNKYETRQHHDIITIAYDIMPTP